MYHPVVSQRSPSPLHYPNLCVVCVYMYVPVTLLLDTRSRTKDENRTDTQTYSPVLLDIDDVRNDTKDTNNNINNSKLNLHSQL